MPVSAYYYRILDDGEITRLTFSDTGLVAWWDVDSIQTRVTGVVLPPVVEVMASWSVPLYEVRGGETVWESAFPGLLGPMADAYIDIETALMDRWVGDGHVTLAFRTLPQVLPSDDPAIRTIGMTAFCQLSVCVSEHPPVGAWLMEGAPFRVGGPLPTITGGVDMMEASSRMEVGRLIASGIDRAAMGRLSRATSYVGITNGLAVGVSDVALTEADYVKVWEFYTEEESAEFAEFLKELPEGKLLYYLDTGNVWQDRLDMLLGTN